MAKRGAVIAIDGPSGVGKTTVSRRLADKLDFKYINTGAMYRALALAANEAGIDLHDDAALSRYCSKVSIEYDYKKECVIIEGKDFTPSIRTQAAGELASIISTRKPVRDFLAGFQRRLGEAGSVVMEGRDIGTAVFPDADIKFFLDASHEVRAQRRHLEIAPKEAARAEEVSKEIRERDKRDTGRANSPLKKADDAVYIDTGELDIEGVVIKILKIVHERLKIGNFRS